ncbi:oxidoreductase [Sediminibacillus massiliensis]|uniref:oxidoreductase n=1 Tax=Sediminibacillus massiliensis TaxID=1926277 RepID=UPI00098830BE|nr:oxidoreductase [Sediminibacillus massiliensis]
MKTVIITGASSGFGLLSTLEFAEKGWYVIATMRNLNKKAVLRNAVEEKGIVDRVKIVELDITSKDSINNFKEFVATLDTIDILVNNAGFAAAGFVEEIPIEEYRQQFETNLFGTISVTQAVLPVMRNQNKGTIINISSISGRVGFPGLSPYTSSKHALEGLSESLRLEMKPYGVNVALVEPGSYQTNIWSTGKQITSKSLDSSSPYFPMVKKLMARLENTDSFGNPSCVARLIVKIADQKNPRLRYPIGKGIRFMIILKKVLPWKMWEKIVRKVVS